MPLSLLAEVLLEIFGQVLVESAWGLGKAAVDEVHEKRERDAQLARAQTLALADLLILAASHDHVVTEAERRELAERLPPLFALAGIETAVETHLDGWAEKLRAVRNDDDLSKLIADTASVLSDRKRRQAFVAICTLLRADAIAAQPSAGPFREAGSRSKADSVRIFARALAADPEATERAVRALG